MVRDIRSNILFILFFSLLLLVVIYILYFRNLVTLVYQEAAPAWFQTIIDILYPRFSVEKQRFEPEFFMHKADQIIIRFSLVGFALLIFHQLKHPTKFINSNLRIHSLKNYRILITCFYLGLLYFSWRWVYAFDEIVALAPFYKGVFIFKLLHIPMLPLWSFYSLYILYILSILIILSGNRRVIWSVSAALILIIFQGYFNSFEKIEHGDVTLSYAALLMPSMFYEINRQLETNRQSKLHIGSWSLSLIQFVIAAVYLLAGLEKLLTSGFTWASAQTFKTYVLLHHQPLGMSLIQYDFIAQCLPILALLFQLTFILILYFPQWKWFFLISGILFHVGTRLILGIGPYFSSWVFVYIFFIDWATFFKNGPEQILMRLKNKQKGV